VSEEKRLTVAANNVFFYYSDLDRARRFYEEIIGLKSVADYGFAVIYQVASTSYLTLVDAEAGMHSADEPKTVAIALVTDQLDEWFAHLKNLEVKMIRELKPKEGSPHDGFVVVDPEGYYLEFERFNPHPENHQFNPILDRLTTFPVQPKSLGLDDVGLGFKATIVWIYCQDLEATTEFYETAMGFEQVVDQGWAKILTTAPSGFLGPVDGTKGMHRWTENKGVTISFFTPSVELWFDHLSNQPRFELRHHEVFQEDRAGVRTFVGYDPEGYFVEFDTFEASQNNAELLHQLGVGMSENSS
jgi:catechol 2,3-dioxygenase-like lactoylglutathione lyase family enzyme